MRGHFIEPDNTFITTPLYYTKLIADNDNQIMNPEAKWKNAKIRSSFGPVKNILLSQKERQNGSLPIDGSR